MKLLARSLWNLTATVGVSLLFAAGSTAVAREEHPHMHAASEALRAAQGSAQPSEKLREARRRLSIAKENKGGYRAGAIQRVDEAISALNAGKRAEADKLIKEALSLIEKGIALHPRDGRR